MAKRFTDTEKWGKAWFRLLSPKMKCVWEFLRDNCDHAGVWDIDLPSLQFHIGEAVTAPEIEAAFGHRVERYGDKYLIETFADFQYGDLNPANRVHLSVMKRLEKVRSSKPLVSPLQGAIEGDKDKDKDTDKEKDKEKEAVPPSENVAYSQPLISSHNAKSGIPVEVKVEWEKTLAHHGKEQNWIRDQVTLYRIYQIVKDWKRVKHALAGFREEKKGDDYDPAQHCYLGRLEDKKKFAYLENLGEPKGAPKKAKEEQDADDFIAECERRQKEAIRGGACA